MSEKGFQKGDRLEAIDRKNPWLVCVANIKDIRADGQLLITFDGWSENFDYWCEPTTHEIAPTGYRFPIFSLDCYSTICIFDVAKKLLPGAEYALFCSFRHCSAY